MQTERLDPTLRQEVTQPVTWGLAVVAGRSMEPTLYDGDRLLVHYGAAPRPGRLAVVRLPGDRPIAVKRLVAKVEAGWWVERDNPAEGVDSWLVGAIPEGDVLACALWRVWPLRRGGRANRGPGTAG